MKIEAIWDHMGSISHHIIPLVTICLAGKHTDKNTHTLWTKSISRNQAQARCRPAHVWFKTVTDYL